MGLGIALGIAGSALSLMRSFSPLSRAMDYTINPLLPNALPTPATLVEQRWRRIISEEEYLNEMKLQGYDVTQAARLFTTMQFILNPVELISAKRRGLIKDEVYDSMMKRNHLAGADVARLEKLTEFVPNVQDLIRFAVREVFRDDVALKFGTDQEFPDAILPDAAMVGLTEDVLRKFWRAHWELPSVGQGINMWHRLRPEFNPENPVTDEDLDTLMRAQDIMPFWAKRFRETSFAIPTRVDIRRMADEGLITYDKAEEFYNQLGYSPDDAKLMRKLAEVYYRDSEKSLTRTMIEEAFRFGELSSDESLELLGAIGYTSDDAELVIKLETISQDEKKLKEQIKTLKTQYIRGVIDNDAFIQGLDGLGIVSSRRDFIISEANEEKKGKIRIIPKADLAAMLKKKLITKEEAENNLRADGFREEDIRKYLKLWGVKA